MNSWLWGCAVGMAVIVGTAACSDDDVSGPGAADGVGGAGGPSGSATGSTTAETTGETTGATTGATTGVLTGATTGATGATGSTGATTGSTTASTGSGGTSASSGGGGDVSTSSVTGSSTASGGEGDCVSCKEWVSPGGNPQGKPVCSGDSELAQYALVACGCQPTACGGLGGPCEGPCTAATPATPECYECVDEIGSGTCKPQYDNCMAH